MPFALLVAACLLQPGQSTADFLGKSPAQIVKMGRTKWFDFFTHAKSNSNADMMNAEISYAEALEKVDNETMTHLSRGRRAWIMNLRSTARAYGIDAFDLGMSISIQSHLWLLQRSMLHADVEELVQARIKGTKATGKKLPSFAWEFRKLDEAIKRAPGEAKGVTDFGDYKQATKIKGKLLAEHVKLLKLTKTGTDDDRSQILQFMHSKLTVARAENVP